jgi:hypothetical protein
MKHLNDTNFVNNLSAEIIRSLADQQFLFKMILLPVMLSCYKSVLILQVKYFQDSLKNEKSYADAKAVIESKVLII